VTTRKRTSTGFPSVVVRVTRYEGSMSAALESLGKALNSGLDRWLRRLGGAPEGIPTLEHLRALPFVTLKEQIGARIEAAELSHDDDRIANLVDDVRGLILTAFPTEKRKGAPRKHGDRDAKLWRLYRLEHVGSYAQIGLRPEFRMNSHAVAAAIKRKDDEAEKFRSLVSSLKEPLRILGINLVWEAIKSLACEESYP
jgi:hypothetical protein